MAMAGIPEVIDYNFHVKPILSDRCYHCHGPDEEAREGSLRFDMETAAKALLESGSRAIVQGNRSKSSLVKRIISEDEEFKMPPIKSKLELSAKEKAILIKWIDEGAEFKEHWSFIKPERPRVPMIDSHVLTHNEIDHFIIGQQKRKGLDPSPPAAKERLLRRVYLDLTGLPPGIQALDSFLSEPTDQAYEHVVNELLASEACAERLAMEWMDVARYADSHGMHADGWRNMWPWRDWVIEAFHRNMPYDQFVTEQIAGDLLPGAGKDEILATAFHRNHPMTAEGGVIDEEFRLEYVADRTNTTATAFLGMTMECAKCHDHKFDPISQKEYYQMSAFFNNLKELGMTGDDGNFGPMLTLASKETEMKLQQFDSILTELNGQIIEEKKKLNQLKSYIEQLPPINLNDQIEHYYPFEKISTLSESGRERVIIDHDKKCYTNGEPQVVDGKEGGSLAFDSEYDALSLEGTGPIDVHLPLAVSLWIKTSKREKDKTQVLIGNAGQKNTFWRGWDFYLDEENHLSLRLIHSLPHNYFHISTKDSIETNRWTHVAFSYDGSGKAGGVGLYINGYKKEVKIHYDRLTKNNRPIKVMAHTEIDQPLRIGKSYRAFTGENGIFEGFMDELRIYRREISELEVLKMAVWT